MLANVLQGVGLALVASGAFLIAPAVGLIVGGIGFILIGLSQERGRGAR